ncbi:hypothetical protein OIDMADRAFT_139742 [Oidiodendron maius Zn]|uniref:Uncharacterized protein n=1 Tax=Oidiodendron maius (strain Zn) TaxID=913774 RepID=A0A0C3HXX6_OIDMZ|nr:hypothetical protein OIDMADRAFT_139742 [Oidiodendron maius Zn]
MSNLPLTPDEFTPYIHKGVWERYDELSYRRLKWTLGNFSAIFVTACIAALIGLAQSQCWALIRYIIAQYTKSPRLPDDSTPDPLLELSQGKAIVSTMLVISRRISILFDKIYGLFRAEACHARDARALDDPVESPWFGFASILNISFFLVMGVAIPIWLTEGVLGAPIVKSNIWEECLSTRAISHWPERLNRETRADEIFHVCRDNLNGGCDSAYYLSVPKITKWRSMKCPFTGNICLNNTPSFEITHWNISTFEMGVNSRSKLLMSRRLTCAPVSIDPFLWKFENRSLIYILKGYYGSKYKLRKNDTLILSTMNGPNKFSSENSGLHMVNENGPHDITLLPDVCPGLLELNEFLQRDNGQSFLVINRAGRQYYPEVVNDPFFAAHSQLSSRLPGGPGFSDVYPFIPDHEATALGCVEQFQYCLPESPLSKSCTDWGACEEPFWVMFHHLATQFPGGFNGNISASVFEQWNGQVAWSLKEMQASFRAAFHIFGVHRYLRQRISVHQMIPLTEWGRGPLFQDNIGFDVDREPWVVEVETWFMKAFLNGILAVQDGLLFPLVNLEPHGFSSEYMRDWKSCGRILLRNGNFTNINWIGLWVTVVSFTLICLIGNQIDTIHGVFESNCKVPI